MRNRQILAALAALLLSAPCVQAQREDDRRAVHVRDFELLQGRDTVTIDFTLVVGAKATRSQNTLTVIPILTSDGGEKDVKNTRLKMELTPVVIWGKKAKLLYDRRSIASPHTTKTLEETDALTTVNGRDVHYRISFPFEEWMPGSTLTLDGVDEGCCSAVRTDLGVIAGNLIVPRSDFTVEEEVVIPGRPLTTGEKLAKMFPFVRPAGTGRARDGMIVYFHQGRHNIDLNYRDNRQKLIDILSVIEELRQSGDSDVDYVLMAGYASPEDTYDNNLGLSERRVKEVRQYISNRSAMLPEKLVMEFGGEDWEGLREMVEASDMEDKWEIIDIIENFPIWDSYLGRGREGELMRLRGGQPYKYMYRYFFPELRNAAYITVYYKNK